MTFFLGDSLKSRDFVSSISKRQESITRKTRMTKICENFEIRQKFAEIARFEFGISRETADFLDFPWFAWFPFTFPLQIQRKSSKSRETKKIGSFGWKFQIKIDLSRRIFDGFQKFRHFWTGNHPLSSVECRNYYFLFGLAYRNFPNQKQKKKFPLDWFCYYTGSTSRISVRCRWIGAELSNKNL